MLLLSLYILYCSVYVDLQVLGYCSVKEKEQVKQLNLSHYSDSRARKIDTPRHREKGLGPKAMSSCNEENQLLYRRGI